MDIERINRIARERMDGCKTHAEREPGFIYHHGRRTAQLALRLADELHGPIDRDALCTAALLHDVGRGHEHHAQAGARIARDLLAGLCSPAELDDIGEIIACHNARRQPNDYSLAIRIVQDADILDHCGPLDVWLCFHWSAVHGRTIDDTLEYLHGEHRREQARVRDALNLEASIRLYDQRIEFENRFYAELERVHREGL